MSASKIDKIKLNDGTSIPWLAWGNGTGEAKKQALDAGKVALEAGLDHIDTAQIYKTEQTVQDAIKETKTDRATLYITSKIPTSGQESEKGIREAIDGSLSKLGSPPNLFLIHSPDNSDFIIPVWKVMEEYKDAGKLKSLGVSNFRPQDFEKLLKVAKHKPVANQLEFHPFVLTHLEPVLKVQKEHGIITESYGPLTPLLRHPTKGEPLKPVLQKIADRLSKSTGNDIDDNTVLLLWCKAKDVVAVTTSHNTERIKGLARTATLSEGLTKEEVSEIDEIGKKYHYRFYSEHMKNDFPAPNLPEQ